MQFIREDSERTKSVCYTLDSLVCAEPLKIYATIHGVALAGETPYIDSEEKLEEITKVMQWAYQQHISLKTNSVTLSQEVLRNE